MIFGIEFRDEQDKSELIEKAQAAKEAVCDLWEKMAEHMPELHEIQERNGRYRNSGGYGMSGWNGNLGYRNYGGGSNYRSGGGGRYRVGGPSVGFAPAMDYGPTMMGGYGQFREDPAYTGGNDRRSW